MYPIVEWPLLNMVRTSVVEPAGQVENLVTPLWLYPGSQGRPDSSEIFRYEPIPPINSPF